MIRIALAENSKTFLPGRAIDGNIEWDNIAKDSERIEIRLIWYTSGKGDRDFDTVAYQTIPAPATKGHSVFSFESAHRPWSFSGKLISLMWAIEVIVFPGLEAEQESLVISGNGREVILGK